MLRPNIPPAVLECVQLAHPSWQPVLKKGLEAVHYAAPDYLPALARSHFLPTEGRLFAAFSLPLDQVRYVLVGEGPYPRAESATGVCFMDGAVDALWSENGLSKPVNRATSLRNFMKMLLVADGRLLATGTGSAELAAIERGDLINTLPELQSKLLGQGFLLLNAALVFRPDVPPAADARAWQPFLQLVLGALLESKPTLVLWGKIAEQLKKLPETAGFPHAVSEHPYNLSFIAHQGMQDLFGPMQLLRA